MSSRSDCTTRLTLHSQRNGLFALRVFTCQADHQQVSCSLLAGRVCGKLNLRGAHWEIKAGCTVFYELTFLVRRD